MRIKEFTKWIVIRIMRLMSILNVVIETRSRVIKRKQALPLVMFLMYSIASWNIRGMNQSPKQNEVRQVIGENKLSICAILESHVSNSRLQDLCKRVFKGWDWTSNGTFCSSGSRIILGWNVDVVDLNVVSMNDQVLHTFIRFKADKKELFCSFVYAHNRYIHRRPLWNNLSLHKLLVGNRPWCVLGDFNSALNLEDKVEGSSVIDIAMREFKECVDANELVDINRSGLQFTWNQKPRGLDGILKKIDRIMANIEFLDLFAGAHAIFQPYRVSDHSPAILHIPTMCKFKPRPFKFSNILVQNSRFKQQVKECWDSSVSGFHMFRVVSKLKALKKPFRKMLFREGNIHDRVTKLRHELDEVQRALDLDPFNVDLREDEACYLNSFNEAVLKEECFLKQKAKVEWLRVGDSNSAYFHKVVKSRQARSRIDSICDGNGVQLVDDQVPNAFVSYFTSFLGQEGSILPLDESDFITSTLDPNVALYMIRDVTPSEVKDAIFSMGDDKAPGPDGYSAAFFKGAWDIVSEDVTKAVQEFFVNGKLLKEINHTTIALLPKINSPTRITDFRPISCCNVIFKCISKIIANRIKDSLTTLVSPNQSAFVPGRRIADNILLTQELMHNYHLNRGPSRCAFKVDIQKAYDTVNWQFLRCILIRFGFHERMVQWIMECVTTTSFSISVNGILHGYFKGKRGLRQGDPLSPYLFTLVMEVLTLILRRRVRDSELFTFHHKCSQLNIINLCFADDLFLFAHGDAHSAGVIMDSLEEFKDVSGLSPSLPKSTAYFCNVLNHIKVAILQILPFVEGNLPVKYLGVPLVTTRLIFRDCKELVEKLANRINDWRNKFLSFAGRLQLIQSVLSSMHIYWASVFVLPARIIFDLEQLMRGFLWSSRAGHKGVPKVAWEVVCLPKQEGGLGIRRLESFNSALIAAHIWRLFNSMDSLWVRWIHTYRLRGRNFWDVPMRGNMTWSWRKILQIRPLVRQFFWYNIGNGLRVSAWFDKWCSIGPLSLIVSSRDIHRAGFSSNSVVRDIVHEDSWVWPSTWGTRYPIITSILVPMFNNDMDDRLVWRTGDGLVKSFSVALVWESIRARGPIVDWFQLVWFSHRIPRHAFHL